MLSIRSSQHKTSSIRSAVWGQTSCCSDLSDSVENVSVGISLTLHSAQNKWLDAVEFNIRCQVEVLSGVLVDLGINAWEIFILFFYEERDEKVEQQRSIKTEVSSDI